MLQEASYYCIEIKQNHKHISDSTALELLKQIREDEDEKVYRENSKIWDVVKDHIISKTEEALKELKLAIIRFYPSKEQIQPYLHTIQQNTNRGPTEKVYIVYDTAILDTLKVTRRNFVKYMKQAHDISLASAALETYYGNYYNSEKVPHVEFYMTELSNYLTDT